MGRRGDRRPRKCVVPGEVPGWVSGARWGPRRARVGDCPATLAAELVYGQLVCDGMTFAPGWRATLLWTPHGHAGPSWPIRAEVLPNAVWRRGRLFLRCPGCEQRATRLYVPVVGLDPRCRRCWGLSYESQSWSYKGTWDRLPCSPASAATILKRERQRQAARARYSARRAIL